MHPVLKSALEPLAGRIATLSLEEAQIAPLPGQGRWCVQQIFEHLILTYQLTSNSVSKQLKTGHVPRNRRNLLEFLLRVQTIALGNTRVSPQRIYSGSWTFDCVAFPSDC